MRKLLLLVGLGLLCFLPACEGPEGPQGPPGFDGRDGEDGEDGLELPNLVLETTLNFNEENGFANGFEISIADDDIWLVFIEWEQMGGRPSWRLLPQTQFLQQGVLFYNFQFTSQLLIIFMEISLSEGSTLSAEWTDNQRIRAVYVPAFFAGNNANGRVDFNDYEAVMDMLGLGEEDVIPIEEVVK